MHALKARVHNGRLTLDEPTTLPEGSEVEISVADAEDDLDEAQRAALLAAIDEGLADVAAGRTMTTDELKQSLEATFGKIAWQ
jgi:hypothetical protein